MPEIASSPRRRRIAMAVGLFVSTLTVWTGYQRSVARAPGTEMPSVDVWSAASAVARMGGLEPGAPAISCQPWDIGTGVTGYVWHAAQPRGVVLLQVGWGDYAQRWVQDAHQLIPRLLDQGLSVYAFDLYGNGHSPGARGLVDVDQAVDDHLAARMKLRDQPLPVYVVGHSLGGLVTMASVIRDQDGVSGVVLLAPALKYETNACTRTLARVGAFLAPTAPGPLRAGDPATLTRDVVALAKIRADPLIVLSRLTWLTVAGGANVSHGLLDRYPAVHVPILAIHGTDDSSTLPAGSADMIERVSSKDKTFILVDGGRHNLLDDLAAARVTADTISWLNDRLPA